MEEDHSRKVNYEDYEHAFSSDLLKDFEEGRLLDFDTEKMRGLIYGYTFTEDYKKGIIPDALSMEYWSQKDDCVEQELLILDALMSTGDGTQDNPFFVVCVGQEYELLKSILPGSKMKGQRLLLGHIDCIDIEILGQPQSVYFDISRWFERDKDKIRALKACL
ncbi:MAG: DUF4919 domain-containing protein [Bacteroidales bacterium]|nr:DUF4919 domain-containing protein [Bacteroidales bacterium]